MKVLFVGNSHTFVNDMPELLRQMADSKGVSIDAVQNTSGGRGLEWQFKQWDVRYNIFYGNYDYIVLQHTAHPFPGEQHLEDSLSKIMKMVNFSSATPVLYQCWSEKNNPEGQAVIEAAHRNVAAKSCMMLAPVGEAWGQLRDKYELYFSDGEHTSSQGAYLAACVFFATLTGQSAVGLPTSFKFSAPTYAEIDMVDQWMESADSAPTSLVLDEEFCKAAQEAADRAVGL